MVKEIGLFGSLVRGEDKEESDLDVLVELESL
jgi:predicted nucleotidyltransferase